MSGFDDTVEGENLPHKKIHGQTQKAKAGLVLGSEGRDE
jgi:hypothetical protein